LFWLVALTVTSSNAAVISIDDTRPTGSVPNVFTDIVGTNITLAAEEVVIQISLPVGPFGPVTPGIRSVILLNPPGEPFGPSDFATITVSPPLPDIVGLTQLIELFFQSEGAVGFDVNVALLPPGTPAILETGRFQDVSGLLDTAPQLKILLASSVPGVEPIPEPATWMLAAAGIAAVGVSQRRLKRN
jgi:hypothetical protein